MTTCSFTFADFMKSAGPLISALVALTLFYMNSQREKQKERKKKRRDRRNRAKYISNMVNDMQKVIFRQLKSLHENASKVLEDPINFYSLPIFSTSNILRLIKLLGDESTFMAITKLPLERNIDSKIQFFNDLVSKVDFVHEAIAETLEMTKNHMQYTITEQVKFQIATDNLRTNGTLLMIVIGRKDVQVAIEQSFVRALKIADETLRSNPKQDFKAFYEMLVLPAIEISGQHLTTSFKEVDRLTQLAKVAEKAKVIYEQLINQGKDHAYNLVSVGKKLTDAHKSLELINIEMAKCIASTKSRDKNQNHFTKYMV